MSRVLSYEEKDTWIHRLSGVTKLLFFLLWSITSMISYDTRVLLVMLVCSLIILPCRRRSGSRSVRYSSSSCFFW